MKKSQIIFVSSLIVLACLFFLTQFSPTVEQEDITLEMDIIYYNIPKQ